MNIIGKLEPKFGYRTYRPIILDGQTFYYCKIGASNLYLKIYDEPDGKQLRLFVDTQNTILKNYNPWTISDEILNDIMKGFYEK